MSINSTLNLLVVDDNQLYAERIVELLRLYYDEVNLGFLDDREELIKTLRHSWDVLVFGTAYDMSFTDVVAIVQEAELDLPLLGLMSDEMATSGRNEEGLPKIIDANIIKALVADNETQVVLAVRILHQALLTRREMAGIKHVLSEAEQRANILIKNSKSAVAYLDQGIHIYANDPYLEMFGFESMESLIGVPIIDLIASGDKVKEVTQFLRRFDKGKRSKVEFKFESKRKDSSTFEAKLQLAAATYEGEPVTQVIIQPDNQGNSAELAAKLAEAERRDSLTGLLNRRGFEHQFAELLSSVKSGEANAILLFIRLDGIGKINSTLGIEGVDATVKQVGYVLNEFFEYGEVSRFSDSTFTVLLPDARHDAKLDKRIDELQQKISALLIEVGSRTATTTITIGGVDLDADSPEPKELVNRAVSSANDAFASSNNVGNAVKFYDASLHASEDDTALVEYMQSALKNGQFKLLYQPIYDIETDTSNFFEVFLRLPLGDGTLMTPDKFLPVARAHGLIEKIDRWVLINACKQLNRTRQIQPDARLLVQLTSETLANTQTASVISQLVKAIGGDTSPLALQFNEPELVEYMAVAKKQFVAIKATGSDIAIRDYGATAKTSKLLDYLEPTMARLARNYVTDLSNTENMDTVKSLVQRTSDKGVAVMMPYIEEASTMSQAWSVGARYLQGYYLQEPTENMLVASSEG